MHDPVGDRMKALERASSGEAIPAGCAIYARIDGRGFSSFTRNMRRPFDPRMTAAMRATATHLLEATHADLAYVQSDEISLVWAPAIKEDGTEGEHFFGGKPQKLTSILAGIATAAFTRALYDDRDGLSEWAALMPHFDARVVSMPDLDHAVEAVSWRGQDARRNSIRQLASAHFSHRQLQGQGNREVVDMLAEKGIWLHEQRPEFMNGTLLRRVSVARTLTREERMRIPEPHRPAPDTLFKRHETVAFSQDHPGRIVNLKEVVLDREYPQIRGAEADHLQEMP